MRRHRTRWAALLLMIICVDATSAETMPPHWRNLDRAVEILQASDAQATVIAREYLKLEGTIDKLGRVADGMNEGEFSRDRMRALQALRDFRDAVLPFLTDEQVALIDPVVVGLDPWRADTRTYSFLSGAGAIPFVPERLVLELPVESAEQRALMSELAPSAWIRHRALVDAVSHCEEFRRRLYQASWAGADLTAWFEGVGWDDHDGLMRAVEANRRLVQITPASRERARVMLWALSIAQQVPELATPMLAIVHVLRSPDAPADRVWANLQRLHDTAAAVLEDVDRYGGVPAQVLAADEADRRDSELLESAVEVRDFVRGEMWSRTEAPFDPSRMTATGYVAVRSVNIEPEEAEAEGTGLDRTLDAAAALGIESEILKALLEEFADSIQFGPADFAGWISTDFVMWALSRQDVRQPTAEAWETVLAIRHERVRKLRLAGAQGRFDPADLLDLADAECVAVLDAFASNDVRADWERSLWRESNPVVAAHADVVLESAKQHSRDLLAEVMPLVVAWERAARRTTGWSAPGASIELLEKDSLLACEAERAVRAAMLGY